MKKLIVALSLGFMMFQLACSDSKSNDKGQDAGQLLGFAVVYLSTIWQKVTTADVEPGFTYPATGGLAPGCACPPSLEATTGKTTTYNPDFSFFVKRGSSNNLLIFFMGGGACWDITNCAYNHTYSAQLIESQLFLGLGSTGTLESQGLGGIMDMTNPDNPFRDWTIVWVPYCTGDLGMGQRDNEYDDTYQPGSLTYPDNKVTIHHRGLVNVKLVLKWLENNITIPPDKLFVTGVSAGSYTAVMSFPYIREQFHDPSTKAYVLGDAGVGVTAKDNHGDAFLKIVGEGNLAGDLPRWGVVLPPSVFGTDTVFNYSYSYKKLFEAIALHYSPDRFAQYTAKWDKTQTWFYNIQSGDSIDHPDTWGSEANADPNPTIWSGLMMPSSGAIDIDTTSKYYRYYIGPGINHTILLFPEYYTEVSGGVLLSDWVNRFVNDEEVTNQDCAACPLP